MGSLAFFCTGLGGKADYCRRISDLAHSGAAFIDGWIHLVGGGTLRGGNSGSTLHQIFRADVACA